jgi:hypothetical protein
MNLKTASFLAMIGTLLLTILLVYRFVMDALNVVSGLIPAVTLFSCLIYAFAALTVTIFFFVFHKQS